MEKQPYLICIMIQRIMMLIKKLIESSYLHKDKIQGANFMKNKLFWALIMGISILSEQLFSQNIILEKYFQWYEKEHIINDMDFDVKGENIAIVKEFEIPDGGDAFGREKYIESIYKKIEENERFADPIVCIINLITKEMKEIDYGNEIRFSLDDNKIVYTHQVKPSSGLRKLAETLKGNTINIYDKESSLIETLAIPENNFLMNPQFIDIQNVIYQIGDAVNGAFGGGVGINKINVENKEVEIICPVEKNHQLFNIIGDVTLKNEKIFYILNIPQDDGTYMASEYRQLLKKDDKIFHDFGVSDFKNRGNKYAITDDNKLVVVDEDFETGAVDIVIIEDGEEIKRNEVDIEYVLFSALSPNGKYYICQDYSMSISLIDIETMEIIEIDVPKMKTHYIRWSKNCDRLAIVQEHERFSSTDLITLFQMKTDEDDRGE